MSDLLIFNDSERDITPESPILFTVSNELDEKLKLPERSKVVSDLLIFNDSARDVAPESPI